MVPPKRISDSGTSKYIKKRKAIDLDQKIKIISLYENGQTLTNIARNLDLSVSTVNTIIKDKDRIREAVKGSAPMKSTIITKARTGLISEMEKLLIMWIEDQIQNHSPLSLHLIKAKARAIFEDLKKKSEDTETTFVASHGWFDRFRKRSGYHNVAISGEGASAVNLVQELQLVLEDEDVDEHVDERGEDITTEDVAQLEAQRVEEQERVETVKESEKPKKQFKLKEMAEAFRKIQEGLSMFDGMDENTERFLKIERKIQDCLSAYREIFEETKKASKSSHNILSP